MLTTKLNFFQHLVIFLFQKNFKTITIQTPIIPRYIQLLSKWIHSYFLVCYIYHLRITRMTLILLLILS